MNNKSIKRNEDRLNKIENRTTTPIRYYVQIELKRYEELLAREERLRVLERAIYELGDYESVKTLKAIFGLKREGNGKSNV